MPRHSYVKRKRVYIANKIRSAGKTVPLYIGKEILGISNSNSAEKSPKLLKIPSMFFSRAVKALPSRRVLNELFKVHTLVGDSV